MTDEIDLPRFGRPRVNLKNLKEESPKEATPLPMFIPPSSPEEPLKAPLETTNPEKDDKPSEPTVDTVMEETKQEPDAKSTDALLDDYIKSLRNRKRKRPSHWDEPQYKVSRPSGAKSAVHWGQNQIIPPSNPTPYRPPLHPTTYPPPPTHPTPPPFQPLSSMENQNSSNTYGKIAGNIGKVFLSVGSFVALNMLQNLLKEAARGKINPPGSEPLFVRPNPPRVDLLAQTPNQTSPFNFLNS